MLVYLIMGFNIREGIPEGCLIAETIERADGKMPPERLEHFLYLNYSFSEVGVGQEQQAELISKLDGTAHFSPDEQGLIGRTFGLSVEEVAADAGCQGCKQTSCQLRSLLEKEFGPDNDSIDDYKSDEEWERELGIHDMDK